MKWIAIDHKTDQIIAEAYSYLECSDAAQKVSGYAREPGTVAPYFLTTEGWFSPKEKNG